MKIETIEVNASTVPGLDELQKRYEEENRRWREMRSLELGDIIEVKNGQITEEVVFTRLRQKKFEGMLNGQPYIFDNSLYVRLIRKGEKNESYKTLKLGEPFYINSKGRAELYLYQSMKNGKILGINPIGMIPTTISIALYVGKAADVKLS